MCTHMYIHQCVMLHVYISEQRCVHHLVLFEVSAHSPALVIGKSVPVFLKESVDTRDPTVPGVLQVLQSQPTVLCVGFLSLQPVLGPHTLAVNELTLPRLDVAAGGTGWVRSGYHSITHVLTGRD